MGWEPPREYSEHPEGPEEKMHRDALAEDVKREADAAEADRLIASLRPYHATMRVFSLEEIIRWNVPHRAYPIDD